MRRRPIAKAAPALAVILCLLAAATASAADRIYWGNSNADTIAFAALDGSEAGTLDLGGAPIAEPEGLALDSAHQRIYWANGRDESLASANLSGAGGARFETGELTTRRPTGAAVDPASERLYWADQNGNRILFGELDGSLSGSLPTKGATVSRPSGVTVDPAAGRIYWVNGNGASPISFAGLDGSGGGDLNTLGAVPSLPSGVAVDRAHGRAYWTNFLDDTISFASLDGSGGGQLTTGAATVRLPQGLAVDPAGGRLYWANRGGGLSFANLDGSGGGDLALAGPAPNAPTFPVLLFAPRPAAPPVIDGGARPGSSLACSQGGWAPDLLEAFLYRAPQSFAYQWSRDGIDVPGATASTLVASGTGNYACRVTARNRAGDATQVSAGHAVVPIAFDGPTRVSLALASSRAGRVGRVAVRVSNANPFAISGKLALARRGKAGRAKPLATRKIGVAGRSRLVVKLQLPAPARRALAGGRAVPLLLQASVRDLEGHARTVVKRILLRPSHG